MNCRLGSAEVLTSVIVIVRAKHHTNVRKILVIAEKNWPFIEDCVFAVLKDVC